MMKAITYATLGAAADVLVCEDVATVEPAASEVRVALSFSGVNPSDVKSRQGRPGMTAPAFPKIIPHSDGSGVIEAVGAGVDRARVGQRVWIWNGQWQRPFGTAAEAITLPAEMAVPLPDDVSLETGAILGIPGLTAAEAVFGGGDVAGQTVLVSGGAGTVGFLAVQLAKWAGAKVIATSSPRDMDWVRAAGADAVLDYRSSDLAAEILAANADALIPTIIEVEFGRNIDTNAAVIAPNGRLAAFGSAQDMTPTLPFFQLLFKAVTIDILLIYLLTLSRRLERSAQLHDALSAGALTCPLAGVFPLHNAIAAHEAVEAGGRDGAVLLDCRA